MSDLISRQDAIAKFKKTCTYESIDKNGIKRGEIHSAMTYEKIIKIIESLPSAEPEWALESAIDYLHSVGWLQEHDRILTESAEPERRWIPVTEALPDEYIDVLLQFPHTMAVGYHEDGFWNIITCDDLYSGLDEKDEKPIAWMPLPEAYQGERDGNTI